MLGVRVVWVWDWNLFFIVACVEVKALGGVDVGRGYGQGEVFGFVACCGGEEDWVFLLG